MDEDLVLDDLGLGDPREAQDVGRPVAVLNDRAHGVARGYDGVGHVVRRWPNELGSLADIPTFLIHRLRLLWPPGVLRPTPRSGDRSPD